MLLHSFDFYKYLGYLLIAAFWKEVTEEVFLV